MSFIFIYTKYTRFINLKENQFEFETKKDGFYQLNKSNFQLFIFFLFFKIRKFTVKGLNFVFFFLKKFITRLGSTSNVGHGGPCSNERGPMQ